MDWSKYNCPWTPGEDDTLRRMCADGASDGQIGVALGRTFRAVRTHRHNLGLLRVSGLDAVMAANTSPSRPASQTVPSPHLVPHYRPWSCPSVTKTTEVIGAGQCWSAWLPMQARMAALERDDAARDAWTAERYEFVVSERGLVVVERAAVAA